VKISARTVITDHDVDAVCNDIRTAGVFGRVTYDVESGCSDEVDTLLKGKGALHPYAGAYLTGMSVCVSHPGDWWRDDNELTGYYIPLGHARDNVSARARANITGSLGMTEATHVGFNTPFDWAFLLNEGLLLDVPRKAHDVQIKRWLQDENGVKKLKVLGEMWLGEDASAEQRALKTLMTPPCPKITDARHAVLEAFPELGLVLKSGKLSTARLNDEGEALAAQLRRGKTWSDLSVAELGEYAARDATITTQVDHLLDDCSPERTLEREMKVNAICIDMTRRGVSASLPQLHLAVGLYQAHEDEVRAELLKVHGLENPNSSTQVAALLYDRLGLPIRGRTKEGTPSTDKNALEQLAGDPVAAKIIESRQLAHARSMCETFINNAELSPDGRIHGMYGTTRTVTGRLATSNPNVMNIPREESLPACRQAFMLDPAHGVERLGFDLASAELWVTASITGDPYLTKCLLEGRNLHIETMLSIFGGEPDKHRREYTLSKNGNYGVEYGAGIDQLTIYAAKSGCDPVEARRTAERFHDGHKRTFATQHRMADWLSDKARELGKLPLFPKGRYRHFRSPGKVVQFYTALNALVQGGVAEYMKDTMIELYARGYGELLILQVHDELVFDCPADQHMEAELLSVLTQISHDINPFKFPLTWEPKAWYHVA
jgi:DNA polymerase I-like protein with 3'-5' exonuclease and polymerase domains